MKTTEQRFWSKVDKNGPTQTHVSGIDACWIWRGCVRANGYGEYRMLGQVTAHRVAWIINRGNIPTNMCVLHRCDNRKCVNPSHLFIGSHKDNTQDAIAKGRKKNSNSYKTHCKRGHAFDEGSFIKNAPNGLVWRRCAVCDALRIKNKLEYQSNRTLKEAMKK